MHSAIKTPPPLPSPDSFYYHSHFATPFTNEDLHGRGEGPNEREKGKGGATLSIHIYVIYSIVDTLGTW